MYSDRRGNGQKPHRTKPSRQKTPAKTSRTKTNPCKDTYTCMYVYITKNWGFRDVWRTLGGSRDVWQSVTGGGGQNCSKIAWRTCTLYFMYGPKDQFPWLALSNILTCKLCLYRQVSHDWRARPRDDSYSIDAYWFLSRPTFEAS